MTGTDVTGGRVAAVRRRTAAARAGILAGDTVVAVDGRPVRDVIDWAWLTAEPPFEVAVTGIDGTTRHTTVDPDPGERIGLTFHDRLFEPMRTCLNACEFCFVSMLPPGLRPSLYVRDDDFRLSFLDGNFVTLTNVTDDDIARILEQRLSPLHVSVHAVDPEVRARLVCPAVEDHALEALARLTADGIVAHVQIVLVPGENDGAVLDDTLRWLSDLDGIASVGVVPVGFTSHQSRITRSFTGMRESGDVLDVIAPWRQSRLESTGRRWVHAADELHLAAGRRVPSAEEYDGFPQYENGIGMVRAFLDEFEEAAASVPGTASAVLVTGESFAPVLTRVLEEACLDVRVLAVRNTLLGGNVSVAGLLSGRDIAQAVSRDAEASASATYLVPDIVINCDGLLLDDVSADDLPRLAGADVRIIRADAAGLLSSLRTLHAD
ncbi:MAG: DUF512 domain-containing protein [Coriobacteriia bacterium]